MNEKTNEELDLLKITFKRLGAMKYYHEALVRLVEKKNSSPVGYISYSELNKLLEEIMEQIYGSR